MKTRILKPLVAVFACCLALQAASAHEIWIEALKDGPVVLRFGEYGDEDELVKSPGPLDDLTWPEAWSPAPEGKVTKILLEKKVKEFVLTGATADKPIQAETSYSVLRGKDKPGRKPMFYARWFVPGGEPAKPALNFDLVPTAKPGEVCVYFRGKPLPEMKVNAHFPDGSDKEFTSDKDGLVQVPVTQKGLYMLHCKHQREDINGFASGLPYELVSHNCSVAWRQP